MKTHHSPTHDPQTHLSKESKTADSISPSLDVDTEAVEKLIHMMKTGMKVVLCGLVTVRLCVRVHVCVCVCVWMCGCGWLCVCVVGVGLGVINLRNAPADEGHPFIRDHDGVRV